MAQEFSADALKPQLPKPSDLKTSQDKYAKDKERIIDIKAEQSLVAQFHLIQQNLQIHPEVVYYPCSGPRNAQEGFENSRRVIHVDTDSEAVNALTINGYEAHNQLAETYDPGEPVDVLLLINPQGVNREVLIPHLAKDGHVICNNYHGDASHFRSDERFRLVGITTLNHNNQYVLDQNQNNFDDYFEQVSNDDELKQHPIIRDQLSLTIQSVTDSTKAPENVYDAYKALLTQAREQAEKRGRSLRIGTDHESIAKIIKAAKMFGDDDSPELTPEAALRSIEEFNALQINVDTSTYTKPETGKQYTLRGFPPKRIGELFVYEKVSK